MKKYYKKPELKSSKIELGVFGNYGDDRGKEIVDPSPLPILDRLNFHME